MSPEKTSLFEQWKDLIENQTDETLDAFWKEYSSTETRIYKDILTMKDPAVSGVFQDLANRYESDPVLFMGFLDGINSSLTGECRLEEVTVESQIDLKIDFEKLYFNMLKAGADYLYTLDGWDGILTAEKRAEIQKEFKRSKTVIKEKEPGRNDPCPCGSGKKYKKCCGAIS